MGYRVLKHAQEVELFVRMQLLIKDVACTAVRDAECKVVCTAYPSPQDVALLGLVAGCKAVGEAREYCICPTRIISR